MSSSVWRWRDTVFSLEKVTSATIITIVWDYFQQRINPHLLTSSGVFGGVSWTVFLVMRNRFRGFRTQTILVSGIHLCVFWSFGGIC